MYQQTLSKLGQLTLCQTHSLNGLANLKLSDVVMTLDISQVLRDWAQASDIELKYIQLGKLTQNTYIERFNRTVRQECLDLHFFIQLILRKI